MTQPSLWTSVEDVERELYLELTPEEAVEESYRCVKRQIEREALIMINKIREEKEKLLAELQIRKRAKLDIIGNSKDELGKIHDVLNLVDPERYLRFRHEDKQDDLNIHAQCVVNNNLTKMKSYYSEIQKNRTIKFQPFVSIIGIGTLGTQLVDDEETPESKRNELYVEEKLGKIMLNEKKRFFDENEVFESDGLHRRGVKAPIEHQRVLKDDAISPGSSQPSPEPVITPDDTDGGRPAGPPPGFEPVGSSFFSHIYKTDK